MIDRPPTLSRPTQSQPTCAFAGEYPPPKTWSPRGDASRPRSASRSPWPAPFSAPVLKFSMSTRGASFFQRKTCMCIVTFIEAEGGATTCHILHASPCIRTTVISKAAYTNGTLTPYTVGGFATCLVWFLDMLSIKALVGLDLV